MALKRKGFQRDVKLIANSTSEQCVAALQASDGQPDDVRNSNMEALASNEKIALELRTALRQVLISTKDVPLTDGYKRNLRHESHNLNVTEGALVVLATFNVADTYSPLMFRLVRGGPIGSIEHILLSCTSLENHRTRLLRCVDNSGGYHQVVETFIKKTMSYNSELSVQLLLDCSTIPEVIVMSQTFGDIILEDLFKFSRTWCYTMDRERRKMLGRNK